MVSEVIFKQRCKTLATSPTSCKKKQSGGGAQKAIPSPGLIHVSVIRRKSKELEVKKSCRMKVLFPTDLVLITMCGGLAARKRVPDHSHQ